jgi:hypothetical protein
MYYCPVCDHPVERISLYNLEEDCCTTCAEEIRQDRLEDDTPNHDTYWEAYN